MRTFNPPAILLLLLVHSALSASFLSRLPSAAVSPSSDDEDPNMKVKAVGGMVSLFDPSEAAYDRYAAAIAATEPLRASRDEQAMKSVPFLSRAFMNKDSICSASNCDRFPSVRELCTLHIVKSSRAIRGLGLTVAQFNAISRKVAADDELKRRVMEQAYLYKIASTLTLDKVPLIEDPGSAKLLAAHRRRRLQCFAKSLTYIEDLRSDQTALLKKSLNVRSLPSNLRVCDPNILPLLSPKVQSVCNAFPALAEEIVREHGLNSDEFNKMLEEARRNPIFRWRVVRAQRKVGKKG